MAASTAAQRVRADAPVRTAPAFSRPEPRTTGQTHERRTGGSLRRTTVACVVLVVGSLLAVVAANAYMTQGQVHLTQLQQQLTSELGQHRDLEARVSKLVNPSSVVSNAQRGGYVAPGRVTDLPQVTEPPPSVSSLSKGSTQPRSNASR